MELNLFFDLENQVIDIDYQSFILSFFKHSLEQYDKALYEKWYHDDDPVVKTYTFSTCFPNPTFSKNHITIPSRQFILTLSDYDYQNATHLLNAFLLQINQSFPLNNNKLILKRVTTKYKETIKENNIIVKMLSPLVVRKHQKGSKDEYLLWNDEQFGEYLKLTIETITKRLDIDIPINTFEITPIKPKKTVVKLYQTSMNANLGIYQINGDPRLLDFLAKAGIGSKRSSGFGFFKIIG